MNLDSHEDFFLDEEDQKTPESKNTIDFSTGDTGGKDADLPGDNHDDGRRRNVRKVLVWVISIAVVVLGITFYLRYLNPYKEDALVSGHVTSLDKRGVIFKTFEGVMAAEDAMSDTTKIYHRDFTFTVPDDSLARRIQVAATIPGNRITLEYKTYYATLPWRGNSVNVVTGIVEQAK